MTGLTDGIGRAYINGVEGLLRRRPDADTLFFDATQFLWLQHLEKDWELIRDEVQPLLADRGPIPTASQVQRTRNEVDEWRVVVLRLGGKKVARNALRFPQTDALLDRVPGLGIAIFSFLDGPGYIPPHRGFTKCVLRAHLPVVVPGPPGGCRIQVGSETRSWQAGKALVFDDTHEHQVWNDTDEPRVLLVVDFFRPSSPLLEFASRLAFRQLMGNPFFRSMIGGLDELYE